VKYEGISSAAPEDEAFNLVLLHVMAMGRSFMALLDLDKSRQLVLAGPIYFMLPQKAKM
jgi:hypothetical protein